MDVDCYTVPTYHYTDWYVNGVYVDTQLDYIIWENKCDYNYLPDLFTDGGGGGGNYASNYGGGVYDPCTDSQRGCIYKIEDKPATPTIVDELSNPCLKQVLSEVRNQDLANDITRILNETFGQNDIINVTFMEDVTITEPYTTGTRNEPYFHMEIYLNPNDLSTASKEYVAETMFHEIIHAYLDVEGVIKGELEQHIEMAKSYVDKERVAMMEVFPNLSIRDANALIISGFGQLQAEKPDYFNELLTYYKLDANTVAQINDSYKSGNVGTTCTGSID